MSSDLGSRLQPRFDDALRDHEREIMRFLLRATGDREDATDLFQETWLRAYRAWPRLEPGAALRPWLFRIASNLCRNRVRERMRRARVIAASDGNLDSPAPGRVDAGVLHLRRLIARLPHMQGQALIMRKLGGFEYAEIGAALGCSSESARAHVYQALKKLERSR